MPAGSTPQPIVPVVPVVPVVPDPDPALAPPRPYRLSARLLLLDAEDRVLLLPVHDHDAAWWDLPGGGVEPGESSVGAAVRETLEETGYAVPVAAVGSVCWSGEVTFRWLGRWHWSRQVVHRARLAADVLPAATAMTPEEVGTHGAARWWGLAEAISAGLAVPPFDDVAELAPLLTDGLVTGAQVCWRPPARPVDGRSCAGGVGG